MKDLGDMIREHVEAEAYRQNGSFKIGPAKAFCNALDEDGRSLVCRYVTYAQDGAKDEGAMSPRSFTAEEAARGLYRTLLTVMQQHGFHLAWRRLPAVTGDPVIGFTANCRVWMTKLPFTLQDESDA